MPKDILLEVKDVTVQFEDRIETVIAVNHLDFVLYKGQCLGIVGESGSGKSVTSLTILNIIQTYSSAHTSGTINYRYEGKNVDLLSAPLDLLYTIRGRKISMVFQEPMSALNPVRRCGSQVKEILDIHDIGKEENRKQRILDLFKRVSLPDIDRIYNSYPHELSGGQLQRVCIAMALATEPDIVICDEPTTALDVTVQKQILDLLKEFTRDLNLSLIFISHDLDVVASICDSVLVMYEGKIVERGELPGTFRNPVHPYTKALLTCKPTAENRNYILPTVREIINDEYLPVKREKVDLSGKKPIIEMDHVKVFFTKKKQGLFNKREYVKAVNDVSFKLLEGEILGIVGESGSGKSTVANVIAGLIAPNEGGIKFKDTRLTPYLLSKNKFLRTKIQLVFQDPYSSLNPKMTIGNAITEPLKYHKIVSKNQIEERMHELLSQVGLDPSFTRRYPHQLSGGQRQRACIARALSVNPEILICDESVSALDVSVQAQILNLLDYLRFSLGLSIIFISHDLSVVHYTCDRVLVMKDGQIVEEGTASEIMSAPQHSYTESLIASLPASFI